MLPAHIPLAGTTALDHAILRNNLEAVKILVQAYARKEHRCSGRSPTLAEQGTGNMSVLTLGFATGKIGAARGGKEMNNALLDSKAEMQLGATVFGNECVKEETVHLVIALLELQKPSYSRSCDAIEGGNIDLASGLEHALVMGNATAVRIVLTHLNRQGMVSSAHAHALDGDTKFADNMKGVSVTSKARVGCKICPVHLAASQSQILT